MPRASLSCSPFGTAPTGEPVHRWTLDSGGAVRAEVLSYGGILAGLRVPDPAGRTDDIVLGLPGMAQYTAPHPYLGALVGRYANRIAHGRFTLDGREPTASPPPTAATHCTAAPTASTVGCGRPRLTTRRATPPRCGSNCAAPTATWASQAPWTLAVTYRLDRAGTLAIDYHARTDRPTVVNLTNHSYFNLAGAGRGDVLGTPSRSTPRLPARSPPRRSRSARPHPPPAPPSTSPAPTRSATASPTTTTSSPRRRLRPLLGARPGRRTGRAAARCPCSPTPTAAAAWRCGPRSLASRSTPATAWTARSRARRQAVRTPRGGVPGNPALPRLPNRPEYPATVLRPGEEYRTRTEFRFPHLRD